LILQTNQNTLPTQQSQLVTIGGQKLILQSPSGAQQIKAIASPVQQQSQQQIQFQIQDNSGQQQQQQVSQTQTIQPQQQQIVVQANGSSIAQQLAQGKIQVMNMNGQQVLVKNVGQNQVIVGQVKTSSGNQAQAQVTSVKQTIQPNLVAASPNQQQQIIKTVQMQSVSNSNEATTSEHAALLASHPPGTVIKCVTASVMQTSNGPRIVLQGLQGTEFTQQQTLLVQQQVKQQLLKGNW
jgi:nucleosome-remodeling factor subunit BPTF